MTSNLQTLELMRNAIARQEGSSPVYGRALDRATYERHRPEQTLLYQLIERYWPDFQSQLSEIDRCVPRHVTREFNEYVECGRRENGFLRVSCEDCHLENLVAFSCKRGGFCPSCGARRMVETAALLVDDILPHNPIR
ncbi:MAG: ribosomal protein S27E [Halioglobus sp.]|jgi:ribosomal protein S27E